MTSKQTENLKKEGKSITYSYDPQRRRLENLVVNAKAGTIMDNAYSYDAVSNVLSVKNNAPLPQSGKAGGQMSHSYTYDPLYRLSSATGTYTGADNKTASYTLAMGYDNMHRITSKKQHLSQTGVQFDGTLNAGYELSYTYGSEEGKKFQLDNVRDINYRTEEAPTDSTTINNGHKYEYDANGNLVYINTSRVKRDGKEDDKASEQKFKWDEENRLLAVDENGFVSNYWYDADGERTVKTSGENEAIYVNSEFSGGNTGTARFSLYVSPYLVAGQGGKYTKHIYIGSQRIVSKLGDLASYGADPRRIPYAGNEADGLTINYKDKYAQQLQSIKDNYKTFDTPYTGKDNNDYVNGQGFCCDDGTPEAAQARAMARAAIDGNFKPNEEYEKMQFYYHPDHLGSSSYITNLDGEVSQHIEYVPFGEVFIEERNNTWNTPYLFNAKELDEETGLYYYGARYYDPRISQFLSSDRFAKKYPNLTPYSYCANNPINAVDVRGDSISTSKLNDAQLKLYNENIASLKESKLFTSYYNQLLTSPTIYTISVNRSKADGEVGSSGQFYDSKTKEISVGVTMDYGAMAHELFHAFQDDGGFYRDDKPQPNTTMEAEAIIVSYYVVISELGYLSSANTWNKEMEDHILEEEIPSIENVESLQYQSMFKRSVENMKSYYRKEGINAPTYTSENPIVQPKALMEVIKRYYEE